MYIPIKKQPDLDKAIALLDQSPHLTSLRLTLTQMTITSEVTKIFNDFQFNEEYKPPNNRIVEKMLLRKSFEDSDTRNHTVCFLTNLFLRKYDVCDKKLLCHHLISVHMCNVMCFET